MKFMPMVWETFLARVKPVSTMANPGCMNMTRKPQINNQTMLMEILLWPTVAANSSRVGLPGVAAVTSAAAPVIEPSRSGGRTVAAAGVAWAWARMGIRKIDPISPKRRRMAILLIMGVLLTEHK